MLSHPTVPIGQLRLLETTDLHMHLLGYDYFADRVDHTIGLLQLAPLIATLRETAKGPTLLFDNGDFLQGNPLADHLAQTLPPDQPHPMFTAMNALAFDAITLGNHDFDYGIAFLRQALKDATAAVVSANTVLCDQPPLCPPFAILRRDIPCDDGIVRPCKIGVTGFAPPQGLHRNDATPLCVTDIVESAHKVVRDLRAAGADLIVALCHAGIGAVDHTAGMENAAVPLAAVGGIDVVLLGHTHGVFPNPSPAQTPVIDPVAGTLHGKPAVMAGFYGQGLGLIDLTLAWQGGRWAVTGSDVASVKPDQDDPANTPHDHCDPALQAAHHATVRQMRTPVAQTRVPIQSYLATIHPDLTLQLLAEAMQTAVSDALGTNDLILAAVAPFRCGGPNGLGQYIDLRPGPVSLRDTAAMFPFSDHLCAVRQSGVDLKRWLERSASHYNQIMPHQSQGWLLNPQSPPYNCDAIYGLTYDIDLHAPARFDVHGHEIAPAATRVKNIRYGGKPLRDDQVYTVATNSFRAAGGGGFPPIPLQAQVWKSDLSLRDLLISHLRHRRVIDDTVQPVWRFTSAPNTRMRFRSSSAAAGFLPDHITADPPKAGGCATYTLHL